MMDRLKRMSEQVRVLKTGQNTLPNERIRMLGAAAILLQAIFGRFQEGRRITLKIAGVEGRTLGEMSY